MVKGTVAIIGCILLAALNANAKPGGSNPPFPLEITVLVYNRVHVSPVDLLRAERLAGKIFTEAGIRMRWEEGSLNDETARSLDFSSGTAAPGGCAKTRALGVLRVGLDRGPAHGLPNALGFALPCAKYGLDARIFVDRCETVVQNTQTLFPTVLGHAIAHE